LPVVMEACRDDHLMSTQTEPRFMEDLPLR
jgi:hypothetical protein